MSEVSGEDAGAIFEVAVAKKGDLKIVEVA